MTDVARAARVSSRRSHGSPTESWAIKRRRASRKPVAALGFRRNEEAVRGRELLVIAASSDEDPERERTLVRLLCERRGDGVPIVPAADDHCDPLPELRVGTPVAGLDRPRSPRRRRDPPGQRGRRARRVEHLLALGTGGSAWSAMPRESGTPWSGSAAIARR
jgi:LacI family transcriptional regulator, galactose operon repressor